MLVAGALASMTILGAAHAQITFRSAASAGVAATGNITHVGAGAAATNNGGCPRSVSPAIPGGNVGDLLIALALVRENSSAVATPAGWNLLYSATYAPGNQEFQAFIFYRFAAGGDAITVTATGTCNSMAGRVSRFRGVDPAQPFLNVPVPGTNVVMQNSNNIDTGTETTVDPSAMLLVASFVNDDNGITQGGGWNVSFESAHNMNRDLAFNLHYQLQTTAGAKSISNWSIGATDENIGVIFSLRPAGLRINMPAGTVANDVMVASIAVRPDTMVIAAPAGWTLVRETPQGAGNASRMATYYRVATGSEPASYLWTFSGGSATGATGGIASFAGVDTAAPIDAEGGNTTPSSTSHTANAITTTVANTMLVASFEYTSTPTNWNPPVGMTEAVDQGSIAPPDDAGIKLEMAYQLQAGTGGTGAKTATSVGAAGDTGVAHLLALRPLVVVVTPGSFNAFETGTAPGAITGVIRTKIAGTAFSLDVVAISGGAQQAGFTDAVIVDLLGNNNLGVALDAQNCPTSFTLVQTVAPNPTITGGRSTVNFAAVANSWRDLRVRIRWPTSAPTVASCSTDNFALRPNALAGFSVTDNDWQTAGTTRTLGNTGAPPGGVIHKAGRPFTVQATAVNGAGTPATTTNYTGTPATTLSDCGGSSACPSTLGTVTLGASFVAGVLTANTASYDEVGSFSMQLQDTAFASVDAGDGTPADCSASGRYVCSGALDVGRFVPDHFAVALNTPSFGTACGSFTYVGQRFNYTTAPVITLTARNFAGGTTTNYAGGLWQITNASLTGKSYTAAAGTLDVSGLPGTDPVIFSAGAGTGTLSFGSGTGLFFTRTTPAAPFDADISLAINVIDADGVTAATNPVTFGTATPGNGIAFSSGKSLRFGRLTVRNASGSQLLSLQVPVEAQYWSGAPINGFLTNTLDNCTTIASANDAMGNYAGNLSGSPTCETAVMSGGALSAGRGVLVLAAPGTVNSGSVDLTVNLGATASGSTCTTQGGAPGSATTANLPHLQGNWSGGAYDQNPTARATFGISRGSEEVVFVRENF
jgi:MSHA biogenesis protein MshQ